MLAALSTPGRRGNNEDAFIVRKIDGIHLLAVADGVGGNVAGEVASRIAVSTLGETAESLLPTGASCEYVLKEGYSRAHRQILEDSMQNPEHRGMATTLVSALIHENNVTVANLGDSRAYLLGRRETKQITRDHSLVQEMVDRGVLSPEEAFGHPEGNIITRALGATENTTPDISRVTIAQGEALLLCTDGLSDTLRNAEMRRIVMGAENPEKAATTLIRTALAEGAQDNITVIIYEC